MRAGGCLSNSPVRWSALIIRVINITPSLPRMVLKRYRLWSWLFRNDDLRRVTARQYTAMQMTEVKQQVAEG